MHGLIDLLTYPPCALNDTLKFKYIMNRLVKPFFFKVYFDMNENFAIELYCKKLEIQV